MFSVAFAPFAWMFSTAARADIAADRGYQQGYLYSGLYIAVMLIFGYEALIRWRRAAKDPRYQTYRYATLLAFQIVFFLVVNVIAVQALSTKYAWRAWGLYQPFPIVTRGEREATGVTSDARAVGKGPLKFAIAHHRIQGGSNGRLCRRPRRAHRCCRKGLRGVFRAPVDHPHRLALVLEVNAV
jgi:hypothetical protein